MQDLSALDTVCLLCRTTSALLWSPPAAGSSWLASCSPKAAKFNRASEHSVHESVAYGWNRIIHRDTQGRSASRGFQLWTLPTWHLAKSRRFYPQSVVEDLLLIESVSG
jgi:hypothetical protein